MFCRQLNARFSALFAGYKDLERGAYDTAAARKFINEAGRVRCKDYVFKLPIENGGRVSREFTTTANWFFILTNAAVWFEGLTGTNAPRVTIDFPDYPVNTPFGTAIEYDNAVPAPLVFGSEGGEHFEEYKNLFYLLGDRININAGAKSAAGTYCHGYILLTGLEIDLNGEGV